MNHLLSVLVLLLALGAQANTTESAFKADSSIPQDLKTKILEQMKATFSSWNYGMDGTHLTTSYITVESADIDVNNPPNSRYRVTSVSVEGAVCE